MSDENKEKKYKTLIEFQNDLLDYWEIKRIERRPDYDEVKGEPVFKLIVRFHTHPFFTEYDYSSEEGLNFAFEVLKEKLEAVNAIII